MSDFVVTVPAKCTIAGEHVIINQGTAIVAPFRQYQLTLDYTHSDISAIHSITKDKFDLKLLLLWATASKAMALAGRNPESLTGSFSLKSSIPMGFGLGFSAALCVAVGLWAVYQKLIPRTELFEFAVQLENFFHLKSSGVDIAGVMSEDLIEYSANHTFHSIMSKWKPDLYVSYSGETKMSESCISKVMQFRKEHPRISGKIDYKMMHSVFEIKDALEHDSGYGLPLLVTALKEANECFYDWDLVSPKMNEHLMILQKHALACKIIGAGYGGCVLSLWQTLPPANFPFPLYRLFPES